MTFAVVGLPDVDVDAAAHAVAEALGIRLLPHRRESGKHYYENDTPDWTPELDVSVIDNTPTEGGHHELPDFAAWPVVIQVDAASGWAGIRRSLLALPGATVVHLDDD